MSPNTDLNQRQRGAGSRGPQWLAQARPGRALIWIPISIGLAIVVSSGVVARQIQTNERAAIQETSAAVLREVTGEFELRMESQVRALERLAGRWERSGSLSRADFDAETFALIGDFNDILAISWVDPELVIRWIAPLAGSEQIVGMDLAADPRRRAWFEGVAQARRAMVSRGVLIRGATGFIVSVPLYPDDTFGGFVVAVHRAEETAAAMLGRVAPDFEIELWSGETMFWSRSLSEDPLNLALQAHLLIRGHPFRIVVSPSQAVIGVYRTWLPVVVFAGGCLTALLLPSALYSALLGRRRARSLVLANQDLIEEVRRRAHAEAAELVAHEELQSVIDALPVYVWSAVVGEDGEFPLRYQSRAVEVITGRSADYFAGHVDRWIDMVVPEDRETVEESKRAMRSGDTDLIATEYRLMRSDGQIRYVRDRIRKVKTDEGYRWDGLLIDYTEQQQAVEERLRLEARFQQTQKLESLGVLAGGIAHDFNNLLVAILGHARLGRDELPADSPVRQSIARIEKAAQRAAELCTQMLAYAGMGSFVIEPVDLQETVEEMKELLRASIPATIELRAHYADLLPAVEADASQIRQVVLNLITNAAESIGDRSGVIELRIEETDYDRVTLDHAQFGDRLVPGHYVTLSVSDDGEGMDEQTKRRLFEPFFTTKFKGRGLGLAAVLGIVRSHRGALDIESTKGSGSTISVILPALDGPITRNEQIVEEVEPWRGTGTLLLVEDDEAAREVGRLVLSRAGFKVLEAIDGVGAVECFSKYTDEIRCVVLDLTMPRMDGEETQRHLREIRANVPVILCSGYPEQDAVLRFAGLGLAGFLQKPYLPQDLIERVRVAIGGEDGALV